MRKFLEISDLLGQCKAHEAAFEKGEYDCFVACAFAALSIYRKMAMRLLLRSDNAKNRVFARDLHEALSLAIKTLPVDALKVLLVDEADTFLNYPGESDGE